MARVNRGPLQGRTAQMHNCEQLKRQMRLLLKACGKRCTAKPMSRKMALPICALSASATGPSCDLGWFLQRPRRGQCKVTDSKCVTWTLKCCRKNITTEWHNEGAVRLFLASGCWLDPACTVTYCSEIVSTFRYHTTNIKLQTSSHNMSD